MYNLGSVRNANPDLSLQKSDFKISHWLLVPALVGIELASAGHCHPISQAWLGVWTSDCVISQMPAVPEASSICKCQMQGHLPTSPTSMPAHMQGGALLRG